MYFEKNAIENDITQRYFFEHQIMRFEHNLETRIILSYGYVQIN